MGKSRISKIESIGNKTSFPTHQGLEKNTKGIGYTGDKANFMQQLQHDFIICCATEICQITTQQFVSAVNYTICRPSLLVRLVGRFNKNRRRFVNPGKRTRLSGVRTSHFFFFTPHRFLMTISCRFNVSGSVVVTAEPRYCAREVVSLQLSDLPGTNIEQPDKGYDVIT